MEQELFGQNYLEAFAQGAALQLVQGRNPNLGYLLNSDHRDYYIQILHRMLLFRRDHELEPLNEDIFEAVAGAQELVASEEYTAALFNRHMNQLTGWNLVARRLEKERLRGYRDDRRDRYRYRLTEETVSFLYWLEERMKNGGEAEAEDAGDLLEFVLSRLLETGRMLHRVELDGQGEEAMRKAAGVVFLLGSVEEYTGRISRRLSELAAVLGGFLQRSYTIEEAAAVIGEIRGYIEGYLRRIYTLRQKIMAELEKLRSGEPAERLEHCVALYRDEQSKVPRFMRGGGLQFSPGVMLERLAVYYQSQGQVDQLCRRVNEAAMKVWGKLSSHLRELERRNNRLEQLNQRLLELVQLPEEAVPAEFFRELIASAAWPADPNFWDEFTKAEPPQPRRRLEQVRRGNRTYLKPKTSGGAPVQSLEETRLEELKRWLEAKFADGGGAVGANPSGYGGVEEFKKIMELAKRGLLAGGRSLKKINYQLDGDGAMVTAADEQHSLEFKEMTLRKVADGK